MMHAALVRSPHAHAKITSIDTIASHNRCLEWSAFSPATISWTSIRCRRAWQAGGVKNNVVTPRALAVGEVHQVGDPVAVVVAETAYQARDAADAVSSSWYDRCRRSWMPRRRLKTGAPQLHEKAPNNIVFEWSCGKEAAEVDAALAAAEVAIEPAHSSTSG